MTYFAVTAQYPIFTDSDGTPLENGYVYIGTAGANPITDPQSVYWDDDLFYPAAQPIRTLAGAPNRNGSPSPIYVAESFSVLVQDKNGNQVYYNANGIKNFTDNSIAARRNHIINGRFEVSHQITEADHWQTDVTNYTLVSTFGSFNYELFLLDQNPKYYKILNTAQPGSPAAGDYARYVQVIEDPTLFSGEIVTLSFLARKPASGLEQLSVSLDIATDTTDTGTYSYGVGVKKITLTETFERYSLVVQIPRLTQTVFEALAVTNTGGTLINFWTGAGSDFDDQTNSLGHQSGIAHIADVRLNRGSVADFSDIRTFDQEIALCERYLEASYDLNVAAFGTVTNNGVVFYIAPDTGTDIPSIRFRRVKRTNSPTVTIYSPANLNASDKINHIGTGDEAVVTLENQMGISAITLDVTSLVDGDIYSYHYVINDEFQLP